ncbi:MAG: glycoside hydrolase family 99-like domain-containing protein, partial [Muribaculaceae bacterium]|nr:glycoside hydrolase family 99-like domain-containing protein [Muribaculaceae bacterium]
LINRYFKRRNYVKIDGCPVFGIFDMNQFVRSFGTIDEAAKAMEYFRSEVKKAGFKGLHIQQNKGGVGSMPEDFVKAQQELIDKLGINSHAFYNMGGFSTDYLAYGAMGIDIRDQWEKAFSIPIFPTVSIGWDDSPRFPAKGENDITHFNQTPRAFESFLEEAKQYVDKHPQQPPFIMINAWNEWIEGCYLLPDRYYGYGYLEAVRHVFR